MKFTWLVMAMELWWDNNFLLRVRQSHRHLAREHNSSCNLYLQPLQRIAARNCASPCEWTSSILDHLTGNDKNVINSRWNSSKWNGNTRICGSQSPSAIIPIVVIMREIGWRQFTNIFLVDGYTSTASLKKDFIKKYSRSKVKQVAHCCIISDESPSWNAPIGF